MVAVMGIITDKCSFLMSSGPDALPLFKPFISFEKHSIVTATVVPLQLKSLGHAVLNLEKNAMNISVKMISLV